MVEITDHTVSFQCPIVVQDENGGVEVCKKPVTAVQIPESEDYNFEGECSHAKSTNKAIYHRLCMEVDWITRAFDEELAKRGTRMVKAKSTEREPEEPLDA
jgi:hypothetical protein